MNPAGFAAALAASMGGHMSDWADGYCRAVRDLQYLTQQRGLMTQALEQLLSDLERDAYVIGHEQDNRHQKRKHAAAREALLEPALFPEALPPNPLAYTRGPLTRPTR